MTVTPAKFDKFIIYQGGTFNTTLTYLDSCNTPIDLTGFTARMQARYALTDADPFLDLTTENGGIILGGALGTVQLLVSADDTADIEAGDGVYDLQLSPGTGVIDFILQGRCTVQEMVTR